MENPRHIENPGQSRKIQEIDGQSCNSWPFLGGLLCWHHSVNRCVSVLHGIYVRDWRSEGWKNKCYRRTPQFLCILAIEDICIILLYHVVSFCISMQHVWNICLLSFVCWVFWSSHLLQKHSPHPLPCAKLQSAGPKSNRSVLRESERMHTWLSATGIKTSARVVTSFQEKECPNVTCANFTKQLALIILQGSCQPFLGSWFCAHGRAVSAECCCNNVS